MSNCNCINEDSTRIKEYFEKKEEVASVESVEFQNVAFMLKGGHQLYSEVVVTCKKANKKGELKSKKEKVNFNYNFCPFCGKSYKLEV